MISKNKHIPQGYKDSPLGIIPKEWEVKRLGDLCYNQGDYGLNAPATDYSVDLPTYLRITDIDDNGKFIHVDKKSVNNISAEDYYLKDGDIVFARTGATVGKTYLYDKRDGELVYAGFLIKFSPNPAKLLSYYLKANTETQNYKNWVSITSQRSGQPGINATEYCSYKIATPPIKEQEQICSILQLWDTAIEKQSELIEKLTLRKRALMQQLLTGKKRLPGFSKEWKRIKLGNIAERVTRKNEDDNKNVVTISAQRGFVVQTDFFNKSVASETLDNYFLVQKMNSATIRVILMVIQWEPLNV
jgi:type I restriction enzyme S subunit